MQPKGRLLCDLVKVILEKGGLTGRKVDHSARKKNQQHHCCIRTQKYAASINDYSSASLDK